MTIKEKLQREQEKSSNTILLYQEGMFYAAYEHSAYLFWNSIKKYQVKFSFVKAVGLELVSIGFPMNTLTALVPEKAVCIEDAVVKIELKEDEMADVCNFETWKIRMKGCGGDVLTKKDKQISVHDDIIKQISSFPIESKTPVECMLFLSQIKKRLVS